MAAADQRTGGRGRDSRARGLFRFRRTRHGGYGSTSEEKLVLAKVADILRRIQFGTVVLVVQDGKVVQVEMAEKFRLR